MIHFVRFTYICDLADVFHLPTSYEDYIPDSSSINQGRQSWGVGDRNPQILGRGVMEVTEGLWTGSEILLYLIMFRKYVQKW